MESYAYVFGHSKKGLEGYDEDRGLDHPIEDIQKLDTNWPSWEHPQIRGKPQGGFKFIIAYERELWGEFDVSERANNQYFKVDGSVRKYEPRVHYSKLVNQLRFPKGISKKQYDDFIQVNGIRKCKP